MSPVESSLRHGTAHRVHQPSAPAILKVPPSRPPNVRRNAALSATSHKSHARRDHTARARRAHAARAHDTGDLNPPTMSPKNAPAATRVAPTNRVKQPRERCEDSGLRPPKSSVVARTDRYGRHRCGLWMVAPAVDNSASKAVRARDCRCRAVGDDITVICGA